MRRQCTQASRAVAVGAMVLLPVLFACEEPSYLGQTITTSPVRTEVAHAGPHTANLTLLGIVRPAETVSITAADGGVVSYPERFGGGLRTGGKVREGETLATFDNETVRLELAEARLAAESATVELRRKSRSYKEGIVSQAEYDAAEIESRRAAERLASAERRAAALVVKAPRSGHLVVTRRYPPGEEVPAGSSMADLAAEGAPRVEGWAAGSDFEKLRPGMKVAFFSSEGDAAGRGEIREVAPVLDQTGTAKVVAGVEDARGLPPPGEGVEMRVDLDRSKQVITVPEEAVVMAGGGSVVFVAEGAGNVMTAKRRPISLGGRGGGRVEVTRGLSEGDRVIVAGLNALGDGSMVREAAAGAKTLPAAGSESARPAGK